MEKKNNLLSRNQTEKLFYNLKNQGHKPYHIRMILLCLYMQGKNFGFHDLSHKASMESGIDIGTKYPKYTIQGLCAKASHEKMQPYLKIEPKMVEPLYSDLSALREHSCVLGEYLECFVWKITFLKDVTNFYNKNYISDKNLKISLIQK